MGIDIDKRLEELEAEAVNLDKQFKGAREQAAEINRVMSELNLRKEHIRGAYTELMKLKKNDEEKEPDGSEVSS